MKESRLKNGEPMYVVPIRCFVKISAFATALQDYYYGKSEPFPKNLKKKDAVVILKRQLFHNGIRGEYDGQAFEGSSELGEERNALYEQCHEWVARNYPYLISIQHD